MREVIKEARNVEEAIDLACKELGVERDLINFEIIDLPKRSFFGLKVTPAKVRVYLDEPEPAPAPSRREPEPRAEKSQPPRREPQPRPEPRPQQEPKTAPRPDPRPEAKPAAGKPAPEPVREAEAPEAQQKELSFVSADTLEGKARTASDYVKSVLAEMGVTAGIAVAFTENGIVMRLSGEGLGVIIGRRGETLDALQYLSGLVSNREEGDYMRVTIDSGNYREKREHTLEQLARKLSASAIRYGRPSTLEPMNPYERRIIHATVSRIDGVTSASIGEEPNRRVVITPTNARPQQRRGAPRPGGPGGPRPVGAPRPGVPAGGPAGGPRPGVPAGDPRPGVPAGGPIGGGRPPRRNDGRPGEGRPEGSRPPRRDGRDGFDRDRRGPRPETVKPTPTDVDRAYAKEIEREAPSYVKPDPAEQKPAAVSPARTQTLKEGDDLPLYGKIEL